MGVVSIFGRLVNPPRRASDAHRAKPGEQRFVAIEDMSPQEAAEAAAQQMPPREPQQAASLTFLPPRNPQSCPWPTDSSGRELPMQRGEVSDVPGVGPINVNNQEE